MLSFMLKPTSFQCNIKCDYCFYLEKENFMACDSKRVPYMSLEVAHHFIRQHIQESPGNEVYFTWQGGEPLMAGIDFFEQLFALQQRYAGSKKIFNAIQTNGMLINEKWANFFKKHQVLIGISIDGDEELHNAYRVNNAQKGTFSQVQAGLNWLKSAKVEFNTLTVINNINAEHPLRIYRFLKSLGSRFMQFIPVVETMELDRNFKPAWLDNGTILPITSHFSVSARQYAYFMNSIFDEWLQRDVGRISVQLFESVFVRFCGFESTMCIYRERCGGENIALEANGDLYSCDHFVYPEYKIGNIQTMSEADIQTEMEKLSAVKSDLNRECQACLYKELCYGGCPKHRFIENQFGEKHNYFCQAYKAIFKHLTPAMNFMAILQEQGVPLELVSRYKNQMGL